MVAPSLRNAARTIRVKIKTVASQCTRREVAWQQGCTEVAAPSLAHVQPWRMLGSGRCKLGPAMDFID
jgi:hypothetical protein